MEYIYTIYAHINKINNKIYIGQTKQSLSRRFRTNGEGYKNCSRFYKAVLKYGWNNFKHIILFEKLTLEEANEIERLLIAKYKTTDPAYGYNCALGGNGFSAFSGNQIAQKNKEKWQQGIYNKIKHSVYCIELNRSFESALEAERQTGIDNSSIQKACRGQRRYSGFAPSGQPLHWLFTEEVTPEQISILNNRAESANGVSIPLYCKELQQIFPSAKIAGEQLHIDPSSIRKSIKGQQNGAGRHPQTNALLHWQERPDLIQSNNKISQEKWDELKNTGDE